MDLKEHLKTLRIRNSMVSDWGSMCKRAFQYRWFGSEEEKKLFDIGDRPQIRWGIYFETLVFGSGLDGKTIELTAKEMESVYYQRVKDQATVARDYLLVKMGIPLISAQTKIEHHLEIEGHKIPIEMNADSLFGHNGIPSLIVDTKLTGDTENEFGKWAWGRPEQMDMGQGIMYSEVVKSFFNNPDVKFMYYVADNSKAERTEVMQVNFSENAILEYKYGVLQVYRELYECLMFELFEASPEYNKCRQCPAFKICKSAQRIPELKIIEKENWKY